MVNRVRLTVRPGLLVLTLAASAAYSRPMVCQDRSPRRAVPSRPSVADLARSVVTIDVERFDGSASGSGVIIDPSGVIATAAHVVAGATTARVHLSTGDALTVEGIIDVDTQLDFALIRVAGFQLPVAVLGNSDSLVVGQRLLAIGSPMGLDATVSDGLLSSIRQDGTRRLLQLSIPVSHGSSGGPVFTEAGAVVGLVVSGIRGGGAENLNFALPINYVRMALSNTGVGDAVPLAEAVTVTTGERHGRAEGAATDSGSSANGGFPRTPTPAVVNDSLKLDWSALDGVSMYFEDNDHSRTLMVTTKYSWTRDVAGLPVLERYVTSVWNQGYKDRFKDEHRAVFHPPTAVHEYFRRTAVDREYSEFSWEASVDRGAWHITTDRGRAGSAPLPAGIIPPSLKGAAVAALPDSLPPTVYIWFFTWDSTLTARTATARFEFSNRDTQDVPIAKEGHSCGPESLVNRRKLAVVRVTETVEATQSTYTVLARHPHLKVDPETTKCVSAP